MKQYTLGIIGAGNMAQAIIKGAIEKQVINANDIYVYDVDRTKLQSVEADFGIRPLSDIPAVCEHCDIVLLAIKPNVMPNVLSEIKKHIGEKPIVSIAAGWSADMIKEIVGNGKKVQRLMPNTPLMVGEGMSVFESPSNLLDDEQAFVEQLFSSLGKIEHAPLKLMDAVTAVSGSGPAYVFMFIEALADAGVLCGLPRNQAIKLAAQTVMGASKMVLDTGTHPGTLKDAVCSPGGTTIEAVKSLESDAFRGSVIKAVERCAQKSKALAD